MTTCTAPHCENPTDLYLCAQCVSDLQQWIDKIPALRQDLYVTMAKLDHTAPQSHQGGGGLSTGSAMPLREGAMEARYALAFWEGADAARLAHDQYAGGYLSMLTDLFKQAEKLIDNPEEQFTFGRCEAETGSGPCQEIITATAGTVWANCKTCEAPHNVKQRAEALKAKAKGEPLPPREVRDYLRNNAGISIKAKDFENWVYHGHLSYVLDYVGIGEPRNAGRRIYFPGEVFRIHHAMKERKNVA